MRVGVISSSGGSVISEAYMILKSIDVSFDLYVVVDRDCGIEKFCIDNNIKYIKIIEADNHKFSKLAYDYFLKCGDIDFILLFFHRLVTDDLYSKIPVLNIHPSLLPSFKGFNSIKNAVKEDVRFFGASIHLVNDSIDGGAIIGQIIAPLLTKDMLMLNKISFLQKTYLVLLICDLYLNNAIDLKDGTAKFLKSLTHTISANPSICNLSINIEFDALMEREKVNIFQL